MRFFSAQLIALLGLQAVIGHPTSASEKVSSIQKRDGPGVNGEIYLQELNVGDKIDQGADGAVYKATVKSDVDGWDHNKVWALKQGYRNINMVQKEWKVYKALDGKNIAPAFAAKVTDRDHDDLPEMGILIDYIKTKKTDPNSKDQARNAMAALKKMHDLGYIHGDTQALGNILIRESDGAAFLIDFTNSEQTTSTNKRDADKEALKGAFDGVKWDGDKVRD